jgi:hypothetical protein
MHEPRGTLLIVAQTWALQMPESLDVQHQAQRQRQVHGKHLPNEYINLITDHLSRSEQHHSLTGAIKCRCGCTARKQDGWQQVAFIKSTFLMTQAGQALRSLHLHRHRSNQGCDHFLW